MQLRNSLVLICVLATRALAAQPAAPMTQADISAFLDGLVPAQMERADVAGIVIAVVKDGQVLFAKGYGHADVASGKPVSPDTTLFRPGSISKLFTWTSVMQLYEQGKLDLDRDVNDYLDFKIPPAYSKPITMRNIMTHTSGFEETIKELFVKTERDLEPLSRYLPEHLPARIFPPGTTPAYSNYATTLAGYIVQRISGQPFSQYAADHILKPLRMTHTTFVQPLPTDLKPLMSSGYQLASQPAKPFEFVEAYPAGSVSTSALDMTRFITAHLQDGEFEGARILKPETARLMHSRQFGLHPEINGMCLGFYEESRNGHRIIGHGGDTGWFHSDLHLMADQKLGFFISQNSAGKGGPLRGLIWQKLLDRYFPYDPPPAKAISTAAADARAVSRFYESSRRFQTSIVKLTVLASELRISANSDGTISASSATDPAGQPKHFREIAPMLFRDAKGQDLLAFRRDDHGRFQVAGIFPAMVLQAVSAAENRTVNLAVIIPSLSIFALTLLLWPVAAATRWHFGRKLKLAPASSRARIWTRVVCGANIALAIVVVAVSNPGDIAAIGRRLDPWIHLFQAFAVICAVGSLIVLYNAWRAWKDPKRWWWTRIQETAVLVACAALVWFSVNWQIYNFNLRF